METAGNLWACPCIIPLLWGRCRTSNTVLRVPRVHNPNENAGWLLCGTEFCEDFTPKKVLNGAPVLASIRHKHRSFTCSFNFFISFLLICLRYSPKRFWVTRMKLLFVSYTLVCVRRWNKYTRLFISSHNLHGLYACRIDRPTIKL